MKNLILLALAFIAACGSPEARVTVTRVDAHEVRLPPRVRVVNDRSESVRLSVVHAGTGREERLGRVEPGATETFLLTRAGGRWQVIVTCDEGNHRYESPAFRVEPRTDARLRVRSRLEETEWRTRRLAVLGATDE